MDPQLLTTTGFWKDPAPSVPGGHADGISRCSGLRGHVLFETSGSTGTPKWVALSKQALLASAAAVNQHLEVGPCSRWGLALPIYHVGGFGVGTRAFEAGCPLHVFGHRWDAVVFSEWLADCGITHTSLVPAQVHDLVVAGLCAPRTLAAVVVGGGQSDEDTGREARALGWPVLASFGMTEAASQIATQGPGMLNSLYQPAPIPLLTIWRAETTAEQLLRIAGPALFSGVVTKYGGSWEFRPREEEWHQSRDRVRLADRFLTPIGRADALVKVLGELVDPEGIERELLCLSEGRLSPGSFVVVAVPDARAEHALVPVFDKAADPDAVMATVAAHASQAPGLRRLQPPVILEELPRSPLGKPLRAEIRAILIENILGDSQGNLPGGSGQSGAIRNLKGFDARGTALFKNDAGFR